MPRALRFIFRDTLIELADFAPTRTLLDWLREERRAKGTKEGCNEGDCGACTVVLARLEAGRLAYQPVNACILLLGQLDGTELLTIEDLAASGGLHPVQAAMVKHHASQCGFCTPGIVMSLFAAYQMAPRPVSRAAIEECLAGNLCRCTGYRPIIDAAIEALAPEAEDAFSAASQRRIARLAALADEEEVWTGKESAFFAAPSSLDRFAELALAHPDATILAGGTDIGLWVTKKLQNLPKILWIGRVSALQTIEHGAAGMRLGAGVSLARAAEALGAIDPDLTTLMRRFGSNQVRASGTIGGNIANGSPIGDLAPALIALGATLELRRGRETRRLPLERFFLDYGRQDRKPGEFVSAILVPPLAAHQHFRAFKVTKRFDEDISAVMGAFCLDIAEGRIQRARIAYGGMAGIPKRAASTEAALAGVSLADPHGWSTALLQLDADFAPISDLRASAQYRGKLARALLGKAILEIAGAASATRLHPREALADAR